MQKLVTAAVAAALVGAVSPVNAWWAGPGWGNAWNDWWNEFFGDAYFDFNMSMGGGGRGYGHGSNRWYDHYGYYPYWGGPGSYGYPGYVHPYAYGVPAAPTAAVPAGAK